MACAASLTSVSATEKPTSRRKKKSPSAKRRDIKRLLAWKAKKRAGCTADVPTQNSDIANPAPEVSVSPSVELTNNPTSPEVIPAVPTTYKAQSQDKVGGLCQDYSDCDSDDAIDSDDADDFDIKCDPNGHCFSCLIPAAKVTGGLKKCTRCQIARYCGRDCQIKDWTTHRRLCADIAASQASDCLQ